MGNEKQFPFKRFHLMSFDCSIWPRMICWSKIQLKSYPMRDSSMKPESVHKKKHRQTKIKVIFSADTKAFHFQFPLLGEFDV